MMWNDNKDEMLCREVVLFEPYQFKLQSHERRNAWKPIVENLNPSVIRSFKIDASSVRGRLTGIVAKHKQKNKDELNAYGDSPEHTSLKEALEETNKKMEEAENFKTKQPRKM